MQTVGFLDAATLDGLRNNFPDVSLDSTAITVHERSIKHLLGGSKTKDAVGTARSWPDSWFDLLPEKISDYQAVFYEASSNSLLVVAKGELNGRLPKIYLRLNAKLKDRIAVKVVSCDTMKLHNLTEPRLTLISGSMP